MFVCNNLKKVCFCLPLFRSCDLLRLASAESIKNCELSVTFLILNESRILLLVLNNCRNLVCANFLSLIFNTSYFIASFLDFSGQTVISGVENDNIAEEFLVSLSTGSTTYYTYLIFVERGDRRINTDWD